MVTNVVAKDRQGSRGMVEMSENQNLMMLDETYMDRFVDSQLHKDTRLAPPLLVAASDYASIPPVQM